MNKNNDFISLYVEWLRETESPTIHHRWSALTMLGALIGRRAYFEFGSGTIFPNLYTLLLGGPGTRKSVAIKQAHRVATATGYAHMSKTRTTREKFLVDLQGLQDGAELQDGDFILGQDPDAPREVFICCDEFMEFIGIKNMAFIQLLGVLFDYDLDVPYEDGTKNTQSIKIKDPTVSILGGMTPQNFAMSFPPEILGQGFFSRILIIHGEPSGVKYTIPPPKCPIKQQAMMEALQRATICGTGLIKYTPAAFEILDDIYQRHADKYFVQDARFTSYHNRRFLHLLKLCMLTAFSRGSSEIDAEDVVYANTTLAYAERFMPRALGEFGKSQTSEVANKIVEFISSDARVFSTDEVWNIVRMDLKNYTDLASILANLSRAGKIEYTENPPGIVPVRTIVNTNLPHVDWTLLSEQERDKL